MAGICTDPFTSLGLSFPRYRLRGAKMSSKILSMSKYIHGFMTSQFIQQEGGLMALGPPRKSLHPSTASFSVTKTELTCSASHSPPPSPPPDPHWAQSSYHHAPFLPPSESIE